MSSKKSRRNFNRIKSSPRLKGDSWEYYESWLKGLALPTQENYLRTFVKFLDWMDTDTESLYEFYLEMIKDEDPRKRKKLGMLVVKYQKHLMEAKGFKSATTQTVIKSIKGFFKSNELPFDFKGEKLPDDAMEITNISTDQFRQILYVTGSYKIKAYMLFARDSGLRTGDITTLPIRVVRDALDDPSIEYFTFEVKQRKTGKIATPVIGSECLDALRAWMVHRVKVLKISIEDGDPLFCVEKNKTGFTDKSGRYVREIVIGDWMGDTNMGVAFNSLVKKANIKPLTGETKLPSLHSLRKYHWTTLQYVGIPTTWVEKMQGRVGVGTGGIYTKPNPDQLIEMYKKGYPALSGIDEDQHDKIDKLTQELGLSQYEISELREERDKYRAGYELRTRLQNIIDKAKLEGWPEDIIKKLEENLERAENFEEGVTVFHKLRPRPLDLFSGLETVLSTIE